MCESDCRPDYAPSSAPDTRVRAATPAAKGGFGKGQGWRAVPGGLVRRVADGCEQGHLHGRQSACHFRSGTCRHQRDRRQRGQDRAADSLSEAAAIKPRNQPRQITRNTHRGSED